MSIAEENVRVQSVIDRKLAEKITELGDRLGVSQSKMIYLLLEAAVEDQEWIIKAVTGSFARKVYSALGCKKQKRKAGSSDS